MNASSETDVTTTGEKPREPPPLYGPDGNKVPRPVNRETGKPLPCYITPEGVAILNEKGKAVPLKFSEDGKPIPLEEAYPHLAKSGSGSRTTQTANPNETQRAYPNETREVRKTRGGGLCCCCDEDEYRYVSKGTGGGNRVVVVDQPRAVVAAAPVVAGYPYGYGGYGYGYDPYYSGMQDAAMIGLASGMMMGMGHHHYYGMGMYDDFGWGGYDYW